MIYLDILDKYLNKRGGQNMGDAFKALSDPTRRKILELLQEKPLKCWRDCRLFSK